MKLELDRVVKRYGPGAQIGPISLAIREGEFFSLLGPSGCGKTTLLRCIAGFEDLTSGSIHLGAERLDDRPPNRRDVGLVFQSYALFPHLSVFENVAFGLRLRKTSGDEIARRVGEVLALVGLPELGGRHPGELSGGQQQRVAIARSLVVEPRILLFDEPLSNLDLKLRVQMRHELRGLQRRLGKTFVYVTHDQTEALAVSDRIAVLDQGRVEQIGTPSEIYDRPTSAFVATFIGNGRLIPATVVSSALGVTTVVTSGGLTLATAGSVPAGIRNVSLIMRPERIALLPPDEGSAGIANTFMARIESTTYLGEDIHFSFLVDGRQELRTTIKNHGWASRLRIAEEVRLTVDPRDVLVVHADME